MIYLCILIGFALVSSTLLDAFEVVLLPRPVRRRWRVNRFFFRWTWAAWVRIARVWPEGRQRENTLAAFGPLSMVLLFSAWAACLMFGFGLLHWSLQQFMSGAPSLSLGQAMGVSGDAFFTLGYGDVVPHHMLGRLLVIVEAGTGFGFIALTISYLPVLYQHFSRRDFQLVELAARAGTPPSATALLAWHAGAGSTEAMNQWLRDWELWASDLAQSHAAYPMLVFYRSQHEGHSWLGALAVLLRSCALLMAGGERQAYPQAAATFAAAQRALRVVAASLEIDPSGTSGPRDAKPGQGSSVGPADLAAAAPTCRLIDPGWQDGPMVERRLAHLCQTFEPWVAGVSTYLELPSTSGADDDRTDSSAEGAGDAWFDA
jgi:hypothetical protein